MLVDRSSVPTVHLCRPFVRVDRSSVWTVRLCRPFVCVDRVVAQATQRPKISRRDVRPNYQANARDGQERRLFCTNLYGHGVEEKHGGGLRRRVDGAIVVEEKHGDSPRSSSVRPPKVSRYGQASDISTARLPQSFTRSVAEGAKVIINQPHDKL